MHTEVAWVLVSSGTQVQPQVTLDPDYLSDYLSVSYDYELRQVGHLLLLQPDDSHSHKGGYTLALTNCFLRLKPARDEIKGGSVNIFSTCSLAYKNARCFLIISLTFFNRGW